MKSIHIQHQALENLGVAALFLFGSRAQGISRDGSDYDFGVLLEDPNMYVNRLEKERVYYALYDVLSNSIQERVNLDIVFLDHAPAELLMHVVKHGKVLFASHMKRVANFRQRVMEDYADFAPYRDQFQQATFARI